MALIEMPQFGESVTEGTILRWLKHPGDPVALDEPICEIETEKITAELPSPFAGVLGEIIVAEGETATVGTPLCTVIEATPAAAGTPSRPAVAVPSEAGAPAEATPATHGRNRFYSPVVLRLAAEHGIALERVNGTGIGGRVTRRDVERFLETGRPTAGPPPAAAAAQPVAPPPPPAVAPAPPALTAPPAGPAAAAAALPYDVVTLSPTRRSIAAHLVQSNLEAPQAWTMVEADVTALQQRRDAERQRAEKEDGVHLTLLPYFIRAVCVALQRHPELNARWEGDELRRYRTINCGVAVAAEHGLVVPVIHDAQDLSVLGLARRIEDLAERARERRLTLADVQGGTFTVNNTGTFGSIASKPIVNHPEVAIVTLERVVRRPVVVGDDAIAIRSISGVCLSFDHRALDGLQVGSFLATLRGLLEGAGA